MMPAPDRLLKGDETPHMASNGMCLERKHPSGWMHCFWHNKDELIRFGQGFEKSIEVCGGCYHSFRDEAALEQAFLDEFGEKRPAAEIKDCPFCGERFTSQGAKGVGNATHDVGL